MENVCLRLDSALAKQIEKDMKEFKYSTKTEFIREAVRGKLKEHERERSEKAWAALFAARGILKGKVPARTKEEEEALEKKIDLQMRRHYEKKFGIKLT
ncbi:MAG: ribbon-helix-helix domain-containing protein [Candidatus Diapherotrites archaeon]